MRVPNPSSSRPAANGAQRIQQRVLQRQHLHERARVALPRRRVRPSWRSMRAASWRSLRITARPPRSATPGASFMSVPRPAMLVAMVTRPVSPARATIAASAASCAAFSRLCGTPWPRSRSLASCDAATDAGADQHRPAGLAPAPRACAAMVRHLASAVGTISRSGSTRRAGTDDASGCAPRRRRRPSAARA